MSWDNSFSSSISLRLLRFSAAAGSRRFVPSIKSTSIGFAAAVLNNSSAMPGLRPCNRRSPEYSNLLPPASRSKAMLSNAEWSTGRPVIVMSPIRTGMLGVMIRSRLRSSLVCLAKIEPAISILLVPLLR